MIDGFMVGGDFGVYLVIDCKGRFESRVCDQIKCQIVFKSI
jgi:hypothetical protein